jgi:hypothetical protein
MSEITHVNVSEEHLEDFEDIYESPSDCHRAAAYHFRQAAKQQDLAAQACDNANQDEADLHAFNAYRHQLNAIQYAEMAVMDVQGEDETEEADEA